MIFPGKSWHKEFNLSDGKLIICYQQSPFLNFTTTIKSFIFLPSPRLNILSSFSLSLSILLTSSNPSLRLDILGGCLLCFLSLPFQLNSQHLIPGIWVSPPHKEECWRPSHFLASRFPPQYLIPMYPLE